MTNIPAKFDWVNARSACSLDQAFEELRLGVEEDIKAINTLRKYSDETGYRLTRNNSGDVFNVRRNGSVKPAVTFSIRANQIEIADDASSRKHFVDLTLNDEGRCKLKIGDEEFEHWQVRRRALEKLFFPSTN